MTLPYRIWYNFVERSAEYNSTNNSNNQKSHWLTTHFPYGQIGQSRPGANDWRGWYGLARPTDDDFELIDGADEIIDAQILIETYPIEASVKTGLTLDWAFQLYPVPPAQWGNNTVNGQTYDGVNDWPLYPGMQEDTILEEEPALVFANLPQQDALYSLAWIGAVEADSRRGQEKLFTNGLMFKYNTILPGGFAVGDLIKIAFKLKYLKIFYFNSVVNSMSQRIFRKQGGQTLILRGVGFWTPDADILGHNSNNVNPIQAGADGWFARVTKINFIGQQGQGTTQLQLILNEYTIDSDERITIPMPALAEGTYQIELIKDDAKLKNAIGAGVGFVDMRSFAGDWRTESDGRMVEGQRFEFAVGNFEEKEPRRRGWPLFKTRWRLKDGAGNIVFRNLAEIDIAATDVFYHGELLSLSSSKRSIDDKTGLFQIADMTATVANHQKQWSQIFFNYFVKNQIVDLFVNFDRLPDSFKQPVISMIVDDYELQREKVVFKLKDITQKYFRKKVPFFLCLESEFPDIYSAHIGRPKPEILGENIKLTDPPGAIEAVFVDTIASIYLASRASLHEITQVYSASVLQVEGIGNDYIIFTDVEGQTFIQFFAPQGDNKVTFNARGYEYFPWNSASGYVQNPAYIVLFFLAFILKIPSGEIDFSSFDVLAQQYIDLGEETSGRLPLQDSKDPKIKIQQLMKTFGAQFIKNNEGKLAVARKDLANLRSQMYIFDQIDAIQSAKKTFGFKEVLNIGRAKYKFFATANEYEKTIESESARSQEDYEAQIEEIKFIEFPWTDSGSLAQIRLDEEISKFQYGIKRVNFSVTIGFIDQFDIFLNFRYQDLFGISADGSGEQGRLYYVEFLEVDYSTKTIRIQAIDMGWLLSQCFILGDRDALLNWESATQEMRFFGYLGDRTTGQFSDGAPNKKLCDRDAI